jgi:hypothetical protein
MKLPTRFFPTTPNEYGTVVLITVNDPVLTTGSSRHSATLLRLRF